MTNAFELNDLDDFYQDYLGAEDWTYNGSHTVKIIFSAKDFMAFVQSADLGFSPDMFDTLLDPDGKTWYATEFVEERYDEYRIQTTDVTPQTAEIQKPTPTIGASGGYSMDYTTVDNQQIFLMPLSGNNVVFGDKIENRTLYQILMKYDATIDSTFQFKIGTRIFKIKGILNTQTFNKQLDISVVESL